MSREINVIPFDKEFKVCPACKYRDGFHTMVKQEDEQLKWLLICPSCREIFDIGLTIK